MARRFRKGRSKGSGRTLDGAGKHALKKQIQALGGTQGEGEDWPDDLGLEDQNPTRPRKKPKRGTPSAKPPKAKTTTPQAQPAQAEPLTAEPDSAGSLKATVADRTNQKDRSKPKNRASPEDRANQEVTVASVASGLCWVRTETGEILECALPSRLAANQQSSLAVGDLARIRRDDAGAYRLDEVLPRRTTLSRPDPHNPRRERVIAANVDVVVHVASVVAPPLRPALIDRYLIATLRSGAEALVCINKVDLLVEEELWNQTEEELAPYRQLGLEILFCSAKEGRGLAELRKGLRAKTAVFVGHSGVGKSSLLNSLEPGLAQATADISKVHGTGRHTTTRSSLHELDGGIRLIDTPGIRELGLWRLGSSELAAYFPDLQAEGRHCRFADCSHTHEPQCAVRTADSEGRLAKGRYATYLRIRESLA